VLTTLPQTVACSPTWALASVAVRVFWASSEEVATKIRDRIDRIARRSITTSANAAILSLPVTDVKVV
jgi:hypothetical protein